MLLSVSPISPLSLPLTSITTWSLSWPPCVSVEYSSGAILGPLCIRRVPLLGRYLNPSWSSRDTPGGGLGVAFFLHITCLDFPREIPEVGPDTISLGVLHDMSTSCVTQALLDLRVGLIGGYHSPFLSRYESSDNFYYFLSFTPIDFSFKICYNKSIAKRLSSKGSRVGTLIIIFLIFVIHYSLSH